MKAPRVGRKRGSQRLTPVPAPLRPKKPVRGKRPAKPPVREVPPLRGKKPIRGKGPAKPPSRERRKPVPFPGSSADMKPNTGRPVGRPVRMPTKPKTRAAALAAMKRAGSSTAAKPKTPTGNRMRAMRAAQRKAASRPTMGRRRTR